MLAFFSRLILKIFGWKIKGTYDPKLPKAIIIVVPHTSSWDFPLGLLVRNTLGVKVHFMGKASLFRPPFGWLFYWLGGYPVERSRSTNFVQNMVDIYNREPHFHTVLAPEGTRGRVDKLKTGFYYIAKGAGAAIVMCRFDWGRREVAFAPPFYPGESMEEDFKKVDNFFRGATGKIPALGYLYEGGQMPGLR